MITVPPSLLLPAFKPAHFREQFYAISSRINIIPHHFAQRFKKQAKAFFWFVTLATLSMPASDFLFTETRSSFWASKTAKGLNDIGFSSQMPYCTEQRCSTNHLSCAHAKEEPLEQMPWKKIGKGRKRSEKKLRLNLVLFGHIVTIRRQHPWTGIQKSFSRFFKFTIKAREDRKRLNPTNQSRIYRRPQVLAHLSASHKQIFGKFYWTSTSQSFSFTDSILYSKLKPLRISLSRRRWGIHLWPEWYCFTNTSHPLLRLSGLIRRLFQKQTEWCSEFLAC